MEAAKEYKKCYEAAKSLAREFLDIDEQSLELTNAEVHKIPGTAERVKKIEETVRLSVDKRPENTLSRDEIKVIVCEQI